MAAKNGDTYPIGSTFSEESARAWVAQAKASREEASKRTLAEHEAHLRQYGTGDADYLSKHSYMEEHGLKYVNGMLVRDRWVRSLAGGAEGQARISAPIGGLTTAAMAAQTEAAAREQEVMQNVAYGSGGEVAMFKDRPLVDALCARLAGYCGEGGRNEGAVETLDRLLSEVRAARQGPTPPPERAVTLGEMCSGTDGRGDCEYRTGHAGPHSPSVPPSSPKGQRLNGLGLHRYQGVGAMLGSASGGPCPPEHLGIAQQLCAPGKMFTRETILAILRSRVAMANGMPPGSARQNELADLIQIFEAME